MSPDTAFATTPRLDNDGANGQQIPPASPPARLTPDGRPDLLERLSPAGLDTLDAAQEAARTLGHRTVGTEHLLLALTSNAESAAGKIMERIGTTPAKVRADVLYALVTGAVPTSGDLAFTPRARLAVELAHRASTRIGVPQTGPEHILIGLAAEGEGIAAKVLHKSGIWARIVENQVTADLDGRTPLNPRPHRPDDDAG
jgi:ATP-dependent Clp protease ATP-binding subunit ClpC